MPDRPSRRMRAVRRFAGPLALLVVVAVAVTAWATTSASGASYRTAVVGHGTVQQTLTTTGTLSPVRSADAAFQVAGTVASVRARVGHKVVAGQRLARLDRSTLRAALSAARASLSSAKARLTNDQTGQTSAAAAVSPTSGQFEISHPTVVTTATPRPSASPNPTSGNSAGSVSPAQLGRDQAAVIAAQRTTDRDLSTAKTALATVTTVCADQASSGTTGSGSGALSCAAATAGLLRDQNTVNTDEATVESAERTLSADLGTALKSLEQSQKSATSTTKQQSSTARSTSARSTTIAVTAADLATDQATIDQARATVATAKADLRQATLTAPISGTVTAVTITRGDTVSTGSTSSPAVEIVGSHQEKATVSVSDSQVGRVALGMRAEVTPDGSGRALTGRVVDIATAGTESDSGTITYPITVAITASARSLVSGADAAVSITLATATNVISVPTSAVHYQGSTSYVDLVSGGKSVRHDVKVSAVGPALTQVTSGLTAGQRVVLANLNAAVPSSSTSTRGGFGGGSFTFRGGGPAGGPSVSGFGAPR